MKLQVLHLKSSPRPKLGDSKYPKARGGVRIIGSPVAEALTYFLSVPPGRQGSLLSDCQEQRFFPDEPEFVEKKRPTQLSKRTARCAVGLSFPMAKARGLSPNLVKVENLRRCLHRIRSKAPFDAVELQTNFDLQDIVSVNLERAVHFAETAQ